MKTDLAVVLADLLDRVVDDTRLGAVRDRDEYLALYPGFEEEVGRELDRLASPQVEDGPAEEDPLAGSTIGPYRVLRELGRGGQGVVLLAEDPRLGRRVAVKLLSLAAFASDQALDRFRRESRIASRLELPGICAVHEAGVDGGAAWIAMQLVEGRTLAELVADARAVGSTGPVRLPAPPDEEPLLAGGGAWPDVARAVQLVERLARTLHDAHEAGVVHRDVKPKNVMVTPRGAPILLDFGLAIADEDATLTRSGDMFGTPSSMAPEQLLGRRDQVDRRADVWALGVTLYEALALRSPFDDDTREGLRRNVLHRDPPDPRRFARAIPRDLVAVLEKALEKNPARRYPTALALAEDLHRVRLHRPVTARRAGPPTRLARWAQRNPAAAVAIVVLAAGLTSSLALKARADARAADLFRLRALQDLEGLRARADGDLWPPHPDRIDAMKAWIEDAEDLVAELPRFRARRDELRALALPQTPVEREAAATPSASIEEARRVDGRAAEDGALAGLALEQEQLEARVGERRTFEFPDTDEGRDTEWWHANLSKMVESLEGLVDEETGLLSEAKDAVSEEHGWSVPRRLRFAVGLRDRMAAGGEWGDRWAEAIAAIREHPDYGGLELARQMGLVPIGTDPESSLWEFWHVATGAEPLRGEDRRLLLTEETGLVLVLIPKGTFWMGAQATDPGGHNFDDQARDEEGPVHEVPLTAYFLSKYEMTQGQWMRFTGRNPSFYEPPSNFASDVRHPVETVSWEDCERELERMGLSLPSEAQWERGCRAGTETPWWTGPERESLRERNAVNLADQAAARAGWPWQDIKAWPELDDAYAVHAPVGTYAANALGLHEVHGNVWEWCLDEYSGSYGRGPESAPGAAWESAAPRVRRGGCFSNNAAFARSAHRNVITASYAFSNLGVRPAARVEP